MIENTMDFKDALDMYSVVCVPTNSKIVDGLAVMGAGVARVAADMFPGVRGVLAEHLKTWGNVPGLLGYWANSTKSFFPPDRKPPVFINRTEIWSFPTKDDWDMPSTIPLIVQSAKLLDWELRHREAKLVGLPHPGCGRGGLHWKFVKFHLRQILDDRYIAFTK